MEVRYSTCSGRNMRGNDRIVKHITVSPDAQRLALRLVQCTCKTLVLQCALI